MKKFGFTLAEVLITLSIIGVISAITLPSLTLSTRNAQVGPKLAKATAAFEQANQALLNDKDVDSLRNAGILPAQSNGDMDDYVEDLRNYMKISVLDASIYNDDNPWTDGIGSEGQGDGDANCNVGAPDKFNKYITTKDGAVYGIKFVPPEVSISADVTRFPHRDQIGSIIIDINGVAKPNAKGRDIFAFAWFADGSLRPVGSIDWSEVTQWKDGCRWDKLCSANAEMQDGYACTGHIFANDLKVLYR